MRAATPGPPPPRQFRCPCPNLLLPADGAGSTLANDVVTLQWASVGVLRDGEAYQITVEDITADQTRRLTDYVTDTKYIVPTAYRPKDNVAHVLRWWITPVRQAGATIRVSLLGFPRRGQCQARLHLGGSSRRRHTQSLGQIKAGALTNIQKKPFIISEVAKDFRYSLKETLNGYPLFQS